MMTKVAAAALAALALSGAANAATVTFDAGKPGENGIYLESGFAFDPVRIVKGNCLAGACAALHDNETMKMTRLDGGLFDLSEISFSLLGKGEVVRARDKKSTPEGGNTLTLTTDQGLILSLSTAAFRHNQDHVAGLDPELFAGLRSVVFSTGSGGNVRLDGFLASTPDFGSAQAPAVPLPAAAWLMIGALGWLGGLGLRRARNV